MDKNKQIALVGLKNHNQENKTFDLEIEYFDGDELFLKNVTYDEIMEQNYIKYTNKSSWYLLDYLYEYSEKRERQNLLISINQKTKDFVEEVYPVMVSGSNKIIIPRDNNNPDDKIFYFTISKYDTLYNILGDKYDRNIILGNSKHLVLKTTYLSEAFTFSFDEVENNSLGKELIDLYKQYIILISKSAHKNYTFCYIENITIYIDDKGSVISSFPSYLDERDENNIQSVYRSL